VCIPQAGHVVLLGEGFDEPTSLASPHARALGNVLSLVRRPDVLVAEWVEHARPTTVAQIDEVLVGSAILVGRPLSVTHMDSSADIGDVLGGSLADLVVIPPQPGAPHGSLGAVGEKWRPLATQFLLGGGVLVLVDDDVASDGLVELVREAELVDVVERRATEGTVGVLQAGDPLAVGLPPVFVAPAHVGFLTVVAYPIAGTGPDAASIVHRVVLP
jgi:hypothetical protein